VNAPVAIVAAVIRDDAGQYLLVRKRGTAAFMQPGGKREPGEDDLAALSREIREELGCGMVMESAVPLGQFRALAANEAGREVVADLWQVALSSVPRPSAEIDAMIWFDPGAPAYVVLAPLTRDHVLPASKRGEVAA
jgi:8-oxo-dGTP diphosphatase